jgi:hypothetical protein
VPFGDVLTTDDGCMIPTVGKLGAIAAVAMTLFVAGCTSSAQTTSPNKPTSTVMTTIPPLGGYSTTTTLASQSTIPLPTLSITMLRPPVTIQYEPGPVVPVPSAPCTDGELRATDLGSGPFIDMSESQDIIAISTSAPCELYGYPTVEFGGSSHPLAVGVQHSSVVGHQESPRPVAVGTGAPASLLLQTAEGPIFPDCKETGLLIIGVPGVAPSVSVSLPAASFRSAWYVCDQVQVTPFEQGDTIDQYA